jgi:hypothetical protein
MIDKEKLYDLLYAKADKLLKQYNPCNIRVEQGKLICNNASMCKRNGESLCCADCDYLGNNGCTTNCLGCKLGMCWLGRSFEHIFNSDEYDALYHINIPQEFIQTMDKLRKIMHRYGLGRIRCSKEELFNLVTI